MPPAQALHLPPPRFLAQPPLACALARPRRAARRRGRLGGAPDQVEEALLGVLAVALLGAVALGGDDQDAIAGQAAAGEALQALAHGLGQAGRAADVEAELDGGGELVDVLAAGARAADEALLQLALVEGDRVGDLDHGGTRLR